MGTHEGNMLGVFVEGDVVGLNEDGVDEGSDVGATVGFVLGR